LFSEVVEVVELILTSVVLNAGGYHQNLLKLFQNSNIRLSLIVWQERRLHIRFKIRCL